MSSPLISHYSKPVGTAGDDRDLSERVTRAIRDEELEATKRATLVSLAAIAGIIALVFVLLPVPEALYFVSILSAFALIFLGNYGLRRSRFFRPWHGYALAVVVFAIFSYTAFAPNPLDTTPAPPQLVQRFGLFVYAFIFLLPFAFSYSPYLMAWAGVACAATWSVGIAWLYSLPDTRVVTVETPPWTVEKDLAGFLHPNFLNLNTWIQNITVLLIVAAGLAALVARDRRMVYRQAEAERQRTNLSRYFAPNVVEQLADMDEPLGRVRSQPVAVMFADIVGFTRMAEHITPEETITLLRDFHRRLEEAVFEYNGTLDKFLGDGIMATFGTPEVTPNDARDAINCAAAMLGSVDEWNGERERLEAPPIRLSIGIHYGPVVVGNIGSARRLEFAVLGDVVNVSSRIEALTRSLNCQLAVSDGLIRAAWDQSTEASDLFKRFRNRGLQSIRGHDEEVEIWSLDS